MPKYIFSHKDEKHRFEPELFDNEIYAIGYFTVNWATLEHCLFLITDAISQIGKIALPEDATHRSFDKRLKAFRNITKEVMTYEDERKRLLGLANSIGSIERSRHRIVHGIWDWEPSKPEKIKGFGIRPPFEFEEPFDKEKLIELGERVANINFQLVFPGGKEQAEEEVAKRGWSASRSFLLALQGKEPIDPHDPLTNFLKNKKN